MKRNFLALTVCLSMLIVVFTPAAGCKTQTAQTQAINSIATVAKTVNLAYSSYLDLVVEGKVSTNSVPGVSLRYNQFQQAFAAGLQLVLGNTNAPVPAGVLNAASDFNQAVNAAKGAN